MNPQRESRLATMLLVGALMMGASVLCLMLGFVFLRLGLRVVGVSLFMLAPIVFVLGLGLIGFSVFSGLNHNRKLSDTTSHRIARQTYVVARFAINQVGEMIFSNFEFDAPEGRYYVRLRFPDGHDEELECAFEVFSQAGEGMCGDATIQGRWLGLFTPIPRPVAHQQ